MSKYIFVTGGVVSSLGKGITAASIGRLLIERGLNVNVQKLDPYINVDPGTMNPAQHGEVFVTEDGIETDLDIGHYERFLDKNFDHNCNYTTGKIYSNIIAKERSGEYLGATIQVVPHVTSEIKQVMRDAGGKDVDVVIIEVGGTVGDMEGMAYLEAIRQFERELKPGNYCHVHCTLVPYLDAAGEVKTKPTQHSVKELTSIGLNPDIIVCRTNRDVELTPNNRKKIAMFCNLDSGEYVVHCPDCETIYEVPLVINKQGMDRLICKILNLETPEPNLTKWQEMVDLYLSQLPVINIAIVGKYTEVPDSYISVTEAIKHASLNNKYRAKISIISSEDIEMMGAKEILKNFDAVVVPGGFGSRGIEGKILTAQYCRENKVPYLGLCLGMQIAVIEFARNVANITDAHSTEFNESTNNPVIHIMDSQKDVVEKGATMRLGKYNCHLSDNSMSRRLYGMPDISERHRHRYEFNNEYRNRLESLGLVIAGENLENNLVEVIEIADHPYFIATQYHPEFKSRPNRPHPLFVGLIRQAIANK
ncbi:MAG: CTP synthase [Clostridiales bacterium]|nr:CTP synthase [Clostridiales bacterium]